MRKIGIVGAGIMPAGMAQNFLKAGYEVTMWNRTPERLQPLIEAGAQHCDSPKEVAVAADIIIECVSDDEASRSVWVGEKGILAGSNTQKVLITSASLSLGWTDELARICHQKGYKFIDMPLTGSRAGAEGGTLKLLIGGDENVLESIRTELEVISDRIYHFGPNGAGMRFKLILNTLIGIHVNAAAQAARLAEAAGLDIKTVHHAIFDGSMGPASPSTNLLFSNIEQDESFLNFAVKWIEKDLRYAQKMAQDLDIDFDLLNDTQLDYQRAKDSGLAERDLTAIIELFKN